MAVFQGSSKLSLDAKGRMQIPAKHRDALAVQCEGRLTLTRHPHGCLLLFPRPVWEVQRERLAALPVSAVAWKRVLLGEAEDVEIDTNGRILVAPELRESAGITKEVKLLGMGSHFEIWDVTTLAAKEQEAIAAGIPDSIAQFSF